MTSTTNTHTHTHTQNTSDSSPFRLLTPPSQQSHCHHRRVSEHDASMRKGGVRIRQPCGTQCTSEMSRRVHHVRTQALYSSTFIPKPTTYSRTPTECRTALQPHASVPRTQHPQTRHPRSSTAGWRGETCRGRSHTASHSSHRAP